MAEDKPTTAKVVVQRNPSALHTKRITEEQFQRCPSEWLALAKRGHQIIIVNPTKAGPPPVVLGMNGVLFEFADDVTKNPSRKPKEQTENTWLE